MKTLTTIKKVAFPFYRARHTFLMDKWWFRLGVLFYGITIIAIGLYFFQESYKANAGWCYDLLAIYDYSEFDYQLSKCREMYEEGKFIMWLYGLLPTLLAHYLIQFVFFVLIMNFVVLGSKKNTIN